MRFVIDLLYLLAGLAFCPVVIYRMVRHRRYRQGWGQRFGRIHRPNPRKRCIWVHAVSVGEVNATRTLLKEIEQRFGEHEVVISTTTDTGHARANALFGSKWLVTYFPFDFSWVVARAFRQIDPAICLLMELEVWPNFLSVAHRQGVPVVVVNGRISDKSFSQYRRIRFLTRTFFSKLWLVLAQTHQYAERFVELGCPADRVVVTGSLKYDTAHVTDRIEGDGALADQLGLSGTRIWVAGGTGNDEEKLVLDVHQSLIQDERLHDVRLVVVPRKPERFDEVAQLIAQKGFDVVRYSVFKGTANRVNAAPTAVILGDTMGDLRKFYSLAAVIFVGRSLVPMGGSDMMEAAALGKCTLFGPHAFNFRQTVDALLAGQGALLVQDMDALLGGIRKCLLDPSYAEAIARRGQQIIRDNQGATAKAVERITALLPAGKV
jgi:3-deoxy-D-manno-octulosonic-acid transferase